MTAPAGADHSSVRPRRWQIRLADLIVLVLAVGVSAGIARGARDAWGSRLIPNNASTVNSASITLATWRGSPVPWERTAGLVFEVTGVFLIVILARTVFGLLRRGRPGDGGRVVSFIWAVAWRSLAVAILLGFVADEFSVLRVDFARETDMGMQQPGWDINYRARQNLLPVCGALAMVGLALGMGAGAFLDERPSRRRRPTWLFVPLAGLFAVLISVWLYGYSIIAQLVLIALEAVSNSTRWHNHAGPGLSARLVAAGLDAFVAFVSCVALGVVVAGDFERARRGEPWATIRAGRFFRLILLLATIGAGAYVTGITIPAMHPCLAQGIVQILDLGLIVATFSAVGLFALGLAARSVVPRPTQEKAAWHFWLSGLLRYGLMLVLLLSALKHLPASSQLPSGISPSVGRVIDIVGHAQAWLWGLLPYPVVIVLTACLEPDLLQWLIAIVFSTILVVELAIHPTALDDAPFDAIWGSTRSTIEITWLTVALTVICLVAIPILFVAGQALLHVRLGVADWMISGWPT